MSSFTKFLSQMGRASPGSINLTKQEGTNQAARNNAGGSTRPGPTVIPSHAIYPSDLFTPGNDAYILFLRRNPTNKQQASTDTESPIRMALYMPPQIQVNYGTQWEDMELGIKKLQDFGSDLHQGVSELGTQVSGGDTASSLLAELGLRGAGKAIDFAASGANTLQQLEQALKKTRNPHMALLFKGVDFREFQFTFQLMARSAAETESIKDLILGFKCGMHPDVESAEGKFWIYPDSFDIFLCSGPQQNASEYLFQITNSVLTNMSVDYAGSGIPSFFHTNGAPVDIRMTLQFREQEILTRENIKKGY